LTHDPATKMLELLRGIGDDEKVESNLLVRKPSPPKTAPQKPLL